MRKKRGKSAGKVSQSLSQSVSVRSVPEVSVMVSRDSDLLVRARLHWQLGEWAELADLSFDKVDNDSARAEMAMLFAAALGQLGKAQQAQSWAQQALEWGADRTSVARVLISGTLNSLAKAHAVRADSVDEQTKALEHFNQSAQLGLGAHSVAGLVKARVQNQLQSIESQIDPRNALMARLSELLHLGSRELKTDLSTWRAHPLPDVALHYVWDEGRGIWLREAAQGFGYSDGDAVEERIFAAVQACDDVSLYSKDLLAHQTDWASTYHLTFDRVNVLRPFAQRLAGSSVLELGCGCGAITRYLGELGAKVMAVEGSVRRASIAASRCRDLDNVTVVSDKLQDVPFEATFDVVTLIGVLEYSRVYVEGLDPIQTVLAQARRYLKPGGILIVAIENQLGLKYFAGAPEDHGVGVMAGVNDAYREDTVVTFGHKELSGRLSQAGFAQVDTFLPFPDYKMPSLMLHPLALELDLPEWDLASLLRTVVSFERQPWQNHLFSLEQAWPLVARNGLLADLANSFVLVGHYAQSSALSDSNVLASYYSPKRTGEYSQQIEFCVAPESGELAVRRRSMADTRAMLAASTAQWEPYIAAVNHGDRIHQVVQRPKWALADLVAWARVWLNALRVQCVAPDDRALALGWQEYSEWLPGEFLDAVARNLLIKVNGEAVFIDLEWHERHALPLKLVVYRGLLISFASLTSIESPEDSALLDKATLIAQIMQAFGMVMTDVDYARFMPIIDGLARRAQGLPLAVHPIQKPYDSGKFKLRDVLSRTAVARSTLTLYWRTPEEGFNENNTVKRNYDLNGALIRFELALPNETLGINRLRLDIAGRTGCFFVRALRILDAAGSVLWDWGLELRRLSKIGQLEIAVMPGLNQACMVSTGNDPQFEMDLPEDLLPMLSGARVEIEFSALVV
ncbi:methyltransferase domain-containing protein [Thiomicrospira microaerophila]|uniref:class I SAM-dependent methyltransferase n=1 Tax=Thiomicrospira microaerophila TaxID=406020 RepID=UPI00200BB48B|nr:class I SAM-dependent methyltransferase [Thiomicrospira microaerophila]UQB43269.1 methyltransferase domain-containing protein [Thiomicrospira microaerophila]